LVLRRSQPQKLQVALTVSTDRTLGGLPTSTTTDNQPDYPRRGDDDWRVVEISDDMAAELAREAYSRMRFFRLIRSGVRRESFKRATLAAICQNRLFGASIATGPRFSLIIAYRKNATTEVPMVGRARS